LHMHMLINHLAYHFRPENQAQMALTTAGALIWLSFTQKAAKKALKKMGLKMLGGKMVRK
jgi:hypothetical protein